MFIIGDKVSFNVRIGKNKYKELIGDILYISSKGENPMEYAKIVEDMYNIRFLYKKGMKKVSSRNRYVVIVKGIIPKLYCIDMKRLSLKEKAFDRKIYKLNSVIQSVVNNTSEWRQ